MGLSQTANALKESSTAAARTVRTADFFTPLRLLITVIPAGFLAFNTGESERGSSGGQ